MLELMTREAWLKAGKPKIEPPFSVRLDFVFAWPKSTRKAVRDTTSWRIERPDLDNLCKMCLDSISVIVPEDAAVSELHLTKRNGPSRDEGVTITIKQCEPLNA
jgi:Holliday junction resolvase RusA-like endonuclease